MGGRAQTRIARAWRRLGLFLGAALVAIAAFTATAQESDEGLLARLLQDFLSDAGREVRIRGFEGALSSRATMQVLSIADDQGVWMILRDITLDWNRAALFERRVQVNELSAREIHLLRLPDTGDASALPSATARPEFRLPELPVAVNIGELRADRVVIEAPVLGQRALVTLDGSMQLADGQGRAGFEARRIDEAEGQFRFSGTFDNTSLHLALDLLFSEGPEGIAATLLGIPDRPALALELGGAGPLGDFTADLRLATDGIDRVTGEISFVDTSPEADPLAGLQFGLDIAGDLRPLLVADLHPFFGAESRLRAQGARTESGEIDLAELTFNTRTMRLVGRAALGADGLPRVVDLIADVAREDGAPVVLPGTDGSVRLREAALNIEYDAERSRDWLILAGIDRLEMPDLTLARVDLQAQGRLSPGAAAGNGQGNGEPLFDGVFDFAVLGIDAVDPGLQQALGQSLAGFMSLSMPTIESPLEIGGLALEGETVSLTAYGVIEGTTFDGFVEAEAMDLAAFSGLAARSLGGHALFTLRGAVGLVTGALDLDLELTATDLTVDQSEFDSLVAGQAAIRSRLVRDTEGTMIEGFTLEAGGLRLSAAGHLRPGDTRLDTRFAIDDLATMGAGYGGAVAAGAQVASDGERHQVTLDGVLRDLSPGNLPGAEALRALLAGETRLDLEAAIEGESLTLGRAAIEGPQLGVMASGIWSPEETDLALDLGRLDIAGIAPGVAGRLSGEARLTGDAQRRRVDLALASEGALRTGVPELDNLLVAPVSLTAAASLAADGALAIEAARLTTTGLTIEGSGRQGSDGAARFALDGRIDDIARAVPGITGVGTLEVRLARLAGVSDYSTTFALRGPSGLAIEGSGRIADAFDRVALQAAGQVDAAIANPRIEPFSVQGPIRFDVRLDGPPRIQSLRGRASLSGGRFVSPNVGVSFQNISATAELMGMWSQVRINAEATRGGQIEIAGAIALDGRRDADLSLRVDALRIAMPRLFEAVISGEGRLAGPLATGPRVSGVVSVIEAEIRIPNSPLSRAGYIPEGLRHVGESAASRATRTWAGISTGQRNGNGSVPYLLDLEVRAPGRVYVRGRGLDAEMGGTLRLSGTTQDVIPSGSFGLIRGRLDLLGNRFVLTDGSASLIGSFIPFIRLIATSDSGGVVTSIILEGEADAPEIRFESVPELPQDEVLARLIFRRSLASLSPFQAAQLALSVATLTGRAESSFLTRTREALGLDDLDVTTDADGNTALRAGRYLSERVYSDVSVDSAGRGEVSINLELTPSFTLRGRTDTEGRSGFGIFFERDY